MIFSSMYDVADCEPVIKQPVSHWGPSALGRVQFGHCVVEAVITLLVRRRFPHHSYCARNVFFQFYKSRRLRIIWKSSFIDLLPWEVQKLLIQNKIFIYLLLWFLYWMFPDRQGFWQVWSKHPSLSVPRWGSAAEMNSQSYWLSHACSRARCP